MVEKKIKLLIVDDSLVFCRFLSVQLPKINNRINIVGYAVNAFEAMEKIKELKPDVISLDVQMPEMSGIDFLKKLLPTNPIPIILVTSLSMNVFDALSYGAVDFVKKPDMTKSYTTEIFAKTLASKVAIAINARVKVPRSLKSTAESKAPAVNKAGSQSSALNSPQRTSGGAETAAVPSALLKLSSPKFNLNEFVIAIGASTGGCDATLEVLKQLPKDTPGIVVTQHMPEGFTKMYAERLNKICKIEVREAKPGDLIRRGLILISPGGERHTEIVKDNLNFRIKCMPGSKVSGHRPSVDVLFNSAAKAAGRNAIGIILTGMGADGANGLLAMRQSGAYTIGQSRESCVVYGMPNQANKRGGVCTEAPCEKIPTLIVNYLNSGKK